MQPTAIERQIIAAASIPALNGLQQAALHASEPNLILLAPTGSGKTLAFAAAILRRVSDRGTGIRALVIAPSRELVQQITAVLRPVLKPLAVVALYGGSQFSREEARLKAQAPDVIVATPGRLVDHLNRGTLSLADTRMLVIDEYDKTLELGFSREINAILRHLPRERDIVLTSATEPSREALAPLHIGVTATLRCDADADMAGDLTVVEVKSPSKDKIESLAALLLDVQPASAIVFVNHRESVERITDYLRSHGIDALPYHGGLEQHQREAAVAALRASATRVLVATDLAARGLDITGVDAVIHYHLPVNQQAWTHRNGRTARAGAAGTAYVITSPGETLPEYITPLQSIAAPAGTSGTMPAPMLLLHINAGKQMKISKGDILGFLTKQCGLPASDIGLITVTPQYSLVAVHPEAASTVEETARHARLKNTRVRITPVLY